MAKRYGGISSELMKEFKVRTDNALKQGFIESGVAPICATIHTHPHFTTMWACQGHGIYSRKKCPNHLHIVLAVTEAGLPLLDMLMWELEHTDMPLYWDLSVGRLFYPNSDLCFLENINENNSYTAWRIGYQAMVNEPVLRELRTILNNAFTKVLHGENNG